MRATSDLGKLHTAAQYRLKRIKNRYLSVKTSLNNDLDPVIAYCVIELDNLLISILREFTVSCLKCARTKNRHRITVNQAFKDEIAISSFILSIINSAKYKRLLKNNNPISFKDEPKIRDPKDIEKIFIACNASNISSLQNALSLNPNIFRDIAPVRNFYAHRNEDTWKKVKDKAKNMGIFLIRHPNDLVQTTITGRPVTIFEDWLTDAEIFFEEMMK